MKPKKAEPADCDAFFEALAALKTKEEVAVFFDDLCTPAERESMADRWRVIKPLLDGSSYRQIAQQTGVSVTTVGRVARVLREGSGAYLKIYKRLGGKIPKEW